MTHHMTRAEAATELIDYLDTRRRVFGDTATQLLIEGTYAFASGHHPLRRLLIAWRLAQALTGRR